MSNIQKNANPGFWTSSLSAEAVAAGALRLGRIQFWQDKLYWSEGRPSENSRSAIVKCSDGQTIDVLPRPFSARSRVHEYGGGEFLIAANTLFFVNDADQDIYRLSLEQTNGKQAQPHRLTFDKATRFADFTFDDRHNRLVTVGEKHDTSHKTLPQNYLCSVSVADSDSNSIVPYIAGQDFYAAPRFNASGSKLAFLSWNLPHMPWDSASLYVCDIANDGTPSEPKHIAGGFGEACFQPEWGMDDSLYFVWDNKSSSELYRWSSDGNPVQITKLGAELSKPLWTFNQQSYAILPNGLLFLTYVNQGQQLCSLFDPVSKTNHAILETVTAVQTVACGGDSIAIVGLTDQIAQSIIMARIETGKMLSKPAIIRQSAELNLDAAYISYPQQIVIPTSHGDTVFGLYYPPANAEYTLSSHMPLIINIHGGPTTAVTRGLKPKTLYFTSRGFAWLDLDYSGSTNYGASYRDRLKGQWGLRDVEDTIAAAIHAAASSLADEAQIFVTGGSAGGYTVLMTLVRSKLFRGGASFYGISDLALLQASTHKFEQGYLKGLLGASVEDKEPLYRERSALSYVDAITTPLILFQGAEDQVVPKEQSFNIYKALKQKGMTTEYYEFAGEGHGFRKFETIQKTLELELEFYKNLLLNV